MDPSLDPTVVAANFVTPVMENARVRVYQAHFAPGLKTPLHEHPQHIMHLLTDANFRITQPGGKEEDLILRTGDTRWMEAGKHEVLNTGKNEARMLVIELK
jgi:quercetin dioxygenase-like cupin family protein